MEISYKETLNALDQYANFQVKEHPKDTPKLFLRITKNAEGQVTLKTVSQNEVSFWDKVLRFLGVGGLTLRRVVNLLQSKDFFSHRQAICEAD